MARSRNLKPGFFKNETLAECSPLTRLLFPGLWCIADRAGRLEDRPKRIRAEILPYDDGSVDDMLTELQEAGFILRYEVDGHRFIQVLNFAKHQNPHCREPASTIPAPDKHSASTVLEPDGHGTSPADSLNLTPDSLNPSFSASAPASRGSRLRSDWTLPDDYRQWATTEGKLSANVVDGIADRFKDYWIAQPGQKGIKADWFATWRNWCRKEKPEQKTTSGRFDPVAFVNRNRTSRKENAHAGDIATVIDGTAERVA